MALRTDLSYFLASHFIFFFCYKVYPLNYSLITAYIIVTISNKKHKKSNFQFNIFHMYNKEFFYFF